MKLWLKTIKIIVYLTQTTQKLHFSKKFSLTFVVWKMSEKEMKWTLMVHMST